MFPLKHTASPRLELRQLIAAQQLGGDDDIIQWLGPEQTELGPPLPRGVLHEIYARDGSFGAAAAGFAAGLAMRLGADKALFWITTDYSEQEYGAINGAGLVEFGIDPNRFVLVRLARSEDILRAAGDILACSSVGSVVLEIQGAIKAFDLTASRRLLLSAKTHKVSVVVLRLGVEPKASAAETRWLIHAAPSPPSPEIGDWGRPAFHARLIRHRHAQLGEWKIEWNCENGFFTQQTRWQWASHSIGMATAPAYRKASSQQIDRRAC